VRGLFDTDGSVFCQRDYTKYANDFNFKHHIKIRVRIGSVSEILVNQIFDLLIELKFKCVKRKIKRKFSHNRNNHDMYMLEINSLESINKFFNELKPSNQRHLTKYQIWKKFGFCPPNTTITQRKDILKNKLNPYKLYKQE
jgi:hypothetical protein